MKPHANHPRKSGRIVRAGSLARQLHDKLGQHLVGVTLATSALARKLDDRKAPELQDARRIIQHLRSANREVSRLIDWLDEGNPR